ncbi:3-isopropylmalate dehydratase [Alkaliphilus pronyensis]|uniref:3-isopropylmalate dehydratase n=1 Tax=Alkaliphilus pronyensis TaxID=1482732 RepID=A0A6I0EZ63_9FIRM|nr:aconitase family protein [Alkaliphilus pronyensis]KAB3534429.1 3-isopropylmalate dehydratase [Alkaliphilus pronyensis]
MDSLAKAASLPEVATGQSISIKAHLIMAHDGTWPKIYAALKQDQARVGEANKVLITVDHAFPPPTIQDRAQQKGMAEVCKERNIKLYNKGEGVLHQVAAETIDIQPGMIIVGADGHVATSGAFGGIGFSVSGEELVPVLETSSYQLKVPEVITLHLDGSLRPETMARDVALYILGAYGEAIKGKGVALRGPFIEKISIDSRMTICNLLPEAGVATAFMAPKDSDFEGTVIDIDISTIEPMIAVPPKPTSVYPIKALLGKKITVAIIGGCSSGRIEDIVTVADVLRNNHVHHDVTLIVTPASIKIANKMDQLGLTSILRSSGAVIMPPGCGPCPGKHFGVLSCDDVAITTTVRNSPGRIGAKEAEIYLASPLSVAKAAIKGEIC